MNKRDEFAAAFGAGLLVSVDRSDPIRSAESASDAMHLAFLCADQAVALSAPGAIEALEELVKAVLLGSPTYLSDGMATARTVLARYKKEPE